jgi:transposase
LVHGTLKARPKVTRPSHIKKPADVTAFRTSVAAQIQAVVPPDTSFPVMVHVQDESRWGLRTEQRRRMTAQGVKPVGAVQHEYANTWRSGTIAPASGDPFFLILPHLNTTNMQIFVDAFAHAYPTTFNVLLLENSAAHTSKALRLPDHVAFVFLPPYSPELNPAERVWLDLRQRRAWQQCADRAELETERCAQLEQYDATTLQTLTQYPYLMEAIDVVGAQPNSARVRSV